MVSIVGASHVTFAYAESAAEILTFTVAAVHAGIDPESPASMYGLQGHPISKVHSEAQKVPRASALSSGASTSDVKSRTPDKRK